MSKPDLILPVPTYIATLPNGGSLVFPLADRSLAAIGPTEEALTELLLFLSEHLSKVPPSHLSEYTVAPQTALSSVTVKLWRSDLPPELALPQNVTFTLVELQIESQRWVIVPRLRHAFYLAKGDDVAARAEREIVRIVGAYEGPPNDWLDLLPPREEDLLVLDVKVNLPHRPGQGAESLKSLAKTREREAAIEALQEIGQTPDDARPRRSADNAVVARETEIRSLDQLLATSNPRDNGESVLLVGGAQVGKSTVFFEWLRRRRERGEVVVFATSAAQLIAGRSAPGEWQEALDKALRAAESIEAILFFENLPELFGDRGDTRIDLAHALRPWLQDRRVQCVAEITPEQLERLGTEHAGFFAAWSKIHLAPLTQAQTKDALLRLGLVPEVATALLDLVERYYPYVAYPGKAMRLFDEVNVVREQQRRDTGENPAVTKELVLETFSLQTGIPHFLLREDRALARKEVLEHFRRRMIGQDEAVERLVDTLCVIKAQLQPTGKPLATFLFAGPTGVGKTELARTLSQFLFGTGDRLVRFDMSEYADAYAAERLINGNRSAEGLLTRAIRAQPFSVLLLDEIEKANSAVFDLLLQVTGEGRLTDARGRTTFFNNTIIIMTSNLGATVRPRTLGIEPPDTKERDHYTSQVAAHFRPEFVNRLDRIVPFTRLSPEEIAEVALVLLRKISARPGFLQDGIQLDLKDEVIAWLAERGYSKIYGARALRRAFEDLLVSPVARLLAESERKPGVVAVKLADNRLVATFQPFPPRSLRRTARDLGEVTKMRRAADRLNTHNRVEGARHQLRSLRQELVAQRRREATGRVKRKFESARVGEVQSEENILSRIMERLDQALTLLRTMEDEALLLVLDEVDLTRTHEDLLAELSKASSLAKVEFDRALIYAMLAQSMRAHEITLFAREYEDGGAFALWLASLLDYIDRERWTVVGHILDDREPKGRAGWPDGRRLGPARPSDHLRRWNLDPRFGKRAVLLRISGRWAGALLDLEEGLHRHKQVDRPGSVQHFGVLTVARGFDFADDRWDAIPSDLPFLMENLERATAARVYDHSQNELWVSGSDEPLAVVLEHYFEQIEAIALRHTLVEEPV